MKGNLPILLLAAGSLCFAWMSIVMASEGDLLWDHRYGGNDWDEFRCVVQTPDGGYALAGMTESYGAGLQDFWLVKTDAGGDTLWTRTYGGSNYENANCLIVTDDDGLLLVGRTMSFGAGAFDFWAVKTDANGDTLWTHTYGGMYGGTDEDYGYCVVQTDDGGFALVGFGSYDVLLVRTDSEGNELWHRLYGGYFDERAYWIAKTSDGGFLISGETNSFSSGYSDAWLLKVDANGDSLWSQAFGGAGYEYGYWCAESNDGYVMAGLTGSFGAGSNDAWLTKADAQGDSLWAFAYGTGEIEAAYGATQTDDAFLLTGLYNETYEPGQVYLVKTDLNGNELWSENYGDSLLDDIGFSIIQNSDGNYIIAGRSSTPAGDYEAYLVAVEGLATGVEPTRHNAPQEFALHPVHPNPFNAETALSYQLSADSYVALRIYDTAGKLVENLVDGWRSAGRHEMTFDASHLASGVYLARLTAGNVQQMQKLVLLK